jgi:tetratricopeptide (TPR) repeat protein
MKSPVREDATRQLIARGFSVRDALIGATHSENPETAMRAAMILRSLPWERPGDPPAVRNLLIRYRKLNVEQRAAVISQLVNLRNGQGLDAVLRLLREETDQQTRWTIVRVLRFAMNESSPKVSHDQAASRRTKVQTLDTTADDAPILAVVAASWSETRKDLAGTLYLRAVQAADLDNAGNEDGGEIDLAYRMALFTLLNDHRYDDAARAMRRMAEAASVERIVGVPEPVCQLFALHAKVGPLAGYDDDCRRFAAYRLRPPILYAQSYLALRNKQPVRSFLLDALALCISGDDAQQHRAVGEFLNANFWRQPAARELQAYLALQHGDDSIEHKTELANVHLMLGLIHGSEAEHLQAAKDIEAGLALLDQVPAVITRKRNGRTLTGADARRDLQAEMEGDYLLAAIDRDDQADIAKRIKTLQSLQTDDSEVVQEMVAYLTRTGDKAAADKLFEPVEQKLRDELAKTPGGQQQKSLAWFLARSGRKLDEALKLAKQAVAGDPNNPAFIDTLAEVHFQLGQTDQAVQLEKKALAAEPGRPELEGQMRRFLKGKK